MDELWDLIGTESKPVVIACHNEAQREIIRDWLLNDAIKIHGDQK